MEKEKDSFFGTEGSRSEINEDVYSSDNESTISAASSRSRTISESSVTSVSSKSSAASSASSTVSKASSKSNKSSATEGDTASLVEHSQSTKGSTASLLDTSAAEEDLPVLNSARSEKSNSDATSVNSVRELAAAGDSAEQSLPMKERSVSPVKESEPVKEVTITKPMRPKSAHPSRARRTSTTSSTKSVKIHEPNRSLDTEQHRQRMLLSTGKSSKDVSHLLEAVLVMDQKESQMENKPTNVMQPRMPSARPRTSNYKQNERQREIQKENARLLAELTKNRRPQSATSLSGRSTRSARSINSAFSTASSTSRYSTNFTPIARNYHSKINRDREAKRIDQENLAFLRRLNSVKASPHIRTSRNAVTAAPALRSRPKSIRPTVTHTWQDGW